VNVEVVQHVIVLAPAHQLELMNVVHVAVSIASTLVLHTRMSHNRRGMHQQYCMLVSLPHQVVVVSVAVPTCKSYMLCAQLSAAHELKT